MRSSASLAFALVWAALLGSRTAHAFCRTTTVPLEASADDPSISGQCWTPGTPLAWTSRRVPYGISSAASKYASLADATRVADLAFAAWNGAVCIGGSPSVQAFDVGPLDLMPDSGDCTSSSTCDPNTHDVIEFDDASWPYDDPVNTLALTTVTYGVRDGEIFEARTEINSFMHVLTIGEPSTGGDAIDLQTVLTHEAGHFLGLAHSPEQTAVMYAFYQPGLTQLTPDDEEAICSVYPPHASGCGCRLAPEGPEGMAAGLVLLMAACTFIRRRRRFRATLHVQRP